MKLELTGTQRFFLTMIVGNVKGNAARIRKAYQLLDVIEMSEEDKQRLGVSLNPDGSITSGSDEKMQVEIKDPNLQQFLRDTVSAFDEFRPSATVIDLLDQLGID